MNIAKYVGIIVAVFVLLVSSDALARRVMHFNTLDFEGYTEAVGGDIDPIGHGYESTAISVATIFNREKRTKWGLPPLKGQKLIDALFKKEGCRMSRGREICEYTFKMDTFKSDYYLKLFKKIDTNNDHVILPIEVENYYKHHLLY